MKELIMKNKIVFGATVILLVAGIFYLFTFGPDNSENTLIGEKVAENASKTSAAAKATLKQTTSQTTGYSVSAGRCGFKVVSPAENSGVGFPLKLSGTIDHSTKNTSGCSWNEINARGGTAQLSYYANGVWQTYGVPVNVVTSGILGLASTSAFTASIDFPNSNLYLRSGTPLKITFTEQYADYIKTVDTFDYTLYAK